jgi:hypothetical protein
VADELISIDPNLVARYLAEALNVFDSAFAKSVTPFSFVSGVMFGGGRSAALRANILSSESQLPETSIPTPPRADECADSTLTRRRGKSRRRVFYCARNAALARR